jgi:hypothetical protein
MDANTGEIVATALTTNDVDDASQVRPLLDQVEGRERWPASSRQRFALDKWSLCRLML